MVSIERAMLHTICRTIPPTPAANTVLLSATSTLKEVLSMPLHCLSAVYASKLSESVVWTYAASVSY